MRKRCMWAMGMLMLCTGCVTLPATTQDARVIRAKDKVAPALVHIVPIKEVFTGGKREGMVVQGSGFIITSDGYVVTNEHVAGESRWVKCILSTKEEMDAEVVGTDPDTDIAVLKLKTDRKNLPTVRLGSSGKLEAGQTVLALGSPHGLSRSVSSGIVSVTDRYLPDQSEDASPYTNWIQTDAAINHGNSGGPLVNLRGEVVGINSRKLSNAENVGFAIPVDMAKGVIEEIRRNGKVARSWVGITVQDLMSKTDDPAQKGVLIADINPLSPAGEAGIEPGDILLSVNGVPTDARYVEGLPAARRIIAGLPVGEEVTLRILHGDEERDVKLKTEERTVAKGRQIEFSEWGFSGTNVTPALARQNLLPSLNGVHVTGVQVGSVAANARLQPGDVILRVDGAEVNDVDAFQAVYADLIASEKRLILLDVKRGLLARFVLVKQNGEPVGAEEAPAAAVQEGTETDVE